MKELIIMIGNVGTGKTSYVKNNFNPSLYHVIEPDEVLNEENDKTDDFLKLLIETAINEHDRVVIDGNNLSKSVRNHYGYYKRVFNCKLIAYDFGKGDENSLLARINNPQGKSPDFWEGIHKHKLGLYQQPELNEGFDEIFNVLNGAIISYKSSTEDGL